MTLGLLSLDKVGLEIVISSGSPTQQKYAKAIYPVRKRGNFLLCTLLLGNVAVNSLLAILLADLSSGLIGFLVSTFLIVIFGEIIPQSTCARYGLAIGYYSLVLVIVFMVVLAPIAWPISKILDVVLGREIGTIYSRNELKKLLDIHSTVPDSLSDLTKQETTILAGALDLPLKKVSEIMTPIDNVFMLADTEVLNLSTLKYIHQQGYSRVPVYSGSKQDIVGLLFVKDLALLSPNANLTVKDVLPSLGRKLPRVFDDVRLDEMLHEFKRGQSHLALVRRVNSDGPGDPFYENLGICTLEDVVEEILQDEIIDETDVYVSNASSVRTERGTKIGGYIRLVESEAEEICNHLETLQYFASDTISRRVLSKLVRQSPVEELDEGAVLFSPHKECGFFLLLLEGSVLLEEHGNTVELQKYADLGGILLTLPEDQHTFFPDFTAVANSHVRVLRLTKRSYTSGVNATLMETSEGRKTLEVRHSVDVRTNLDVRPRHD